MTASLRDRLRLLGQVVLQPGGGRSQGRPVLVTGMPRSGTTWVGRTLAQSGAIGYIHEPFKPGHLPGTSCLAVDHWFQYICSENASRFSRPARAVAKFHYNFLAALRAIQGPRSLWRFFDDWNRHLLYRLAGSRALIKDPIALFSAEWLASELDMDVVVVLRHPAAFVSSIKALNWPHDFRCFADQSLLLERELCSFKDRILGFAADPPEDIVDRSILFWKCGYHVIRKYEEAHTDWLFVRHEDLARSPLDNYQKIFRHIGLTCDQRILDYIQEHTAADDPESGHSAGDVKRDSLQQIEKWKRFLTQEEVDRIRTELEPWWRPYYDDTDW